MTAPATSRAGLPCVGRRTLLAAAAALVAPTLAAAQPGGVAPVPKPRHEKVPPPPAGDRYVWQPGSWEWDDIAGAYAWRHGRYVVRRPGTTRFVAGHWVVTGGSTIWQRGRWK
jgi:hypothetical protein